MTEPPSIAPRRGEVTSEDRQEAQRLGAHWSATAVTDLGSTSKQVMALAGSTEALSDPLDALAVERGYLLYGRRGNFSDEQAEVLRTYLAALAWEASRGVEAELRSRWRRFERPAPLPFGAGHRGAELLVQGWMRYLGITDAWMTPASNDGGIDINSSTHVAQVKHIAKAIGRPDLQKLHGVAVASRKQALFFASSSYAAGAVTWANLESVAMPLFKYDPLKASLVAVNKDATDFLSKRIRIPPVG